MAYEFITDLPIDLAQRESELDALAAAWKERRAELDGRVELGQLHERLRRRWAIDTGMIEGLYAIDRGTTDLLIEHGLHENLISHGTTDRPASTIVAYLHDQVEVYDWLFDLIAQRRDLSLSYIKELHMLLTRHQETTDAVDQFDTRLKVTLRKGDWKRLPNNPTRPDDTIHDYCPPEHVSAEMDRLIEWHREHCDADVAAEVEAAWIHHRFTQIHPFQDGNGRVARAIASLVLLRAGRFALSVNPDQKLDYIDALEEADRGDLSRLVEFIIRGQQREFGQALGVAQDLADEKQVFDVAFTKAVETREHRLSQYGEVIPLGESVVETLAEELSRLRNSFNERVQAEGLQDAFRAHMFRPTPDKRHYYQGEIVECAHKLDYYADTSVYRDFVRLTISHADDDRATVLVVSIHSFGRIFKGVLSAVAFIMVIDRSDEADTRRGPFLATDAAFTFGYLQPGDHVRARAKEWIQPAWLALLKSWQDSL